jgi:hypothetical protein
MTIDRWVREKKLPPPSTRIATPLWLESELDAHDDAMARMPVELNKNLMRGR